MEITYRDRRDKLIRIFELCEELKSLDGTSDYLCETIRESENELYEIELELLNWNKNKMM